MDRCLLIIAVADFQEVIADLVSKGLRLWVVRAQVNHRLRFDFRCGNEFFEELKQFGGGVDGSPLSLWKVAKGSSR